MKKLIIFSLMFFVLAGISLACICYIFPDGSTGDCYPAGCDQQGDYCGEEGSSCGLIEGVRISCCEGLQCKLSKCVKSCVAESGACTTNANCCSGGCSNGYCCPTGWYWSIDRNACSKPDYCNVCTGIAIFHTPSCAYDINTKEACCSIDLVGGTTAGTWTTYTIY